MERLSIKEKCLVDMENSVMIAVGGMGGDGEGYKRDKW